MWYPTAGLSSRQIRLPHCLSAPCNHLQKEPDTPVVDYWSLEMPIEREELQTEGLQESCRLLHDLLRQEIAIVGARNVILGGLSQGCAAALVSILLWKSEPLGAIFGFCGWLPIQQCMQDMVEGALNAGAGVDDGDDLFAQPGAYLQRAP